ncbi:hypothetical protein AB0I81_34980 [Nonomuraea sp. NPDC050404]|uniref:hypothetical protein n=1 Tax=Nonomuraea sp. NPDC050404 TaxID=3155783 RepID=UPI0033CA180D
MIDDTDPRIAWLESPLIVEHIRWYDKLSRPTAWQMPMFWLKNDTGSCAVLSSLTEMTVPASAYDNPHWRPL